MSRNRVMSTMVLVLAVAACGGEASDPAADDTAAAEVSVTTAQSQGSAEELVEAVDSEALSMAVMDDSDVPSNLPVPVPAGGEIYPDLGVFEGESLAMHYPSGRWAR